MGWETRRIDAPPTVGGSEERGVFRVGDFNLYISYVKTAYLTIDLTNVDPKYNYRLKILR